MKWKYRTQTRERKITLSFQLFMKFPNLPNKDLWKFYQLFNLLIIHRNPHIYQTNIYENFMDLWPDPTFSRNSKESLPLRLPGKFDPWSQSNLEVRRKIFERRFHNNAPWYSFFSHLSYIQKKTDLQTYTQMQKHSTRRPLNSQYTGQGVYKLTPKRYKNGEILRVQYFFNTMKQAYTSSH